MKNVTPVLPAFNAEQHLTAWSEAVLKSFRARHSFSDCAFLCSVKASTDEPCKLIRRKGAEDRQENASSVFPPLNAVVNMLLSPGAVIQAVGSALPLTEQIRDILHQAGHQII